MSIAQTARRRSMRASLKRIVVFAGWLTLWQLTAMFVNDYVLFANPLVVLNSFGLSALTAEFWLSIALSFIRIALGFLAALLLGYAAGMLAQRSSGFRYTLDSLIQGLKNVAVVCTLALLFLWLDSRFMSTIVVFLVAFPPLYAAMRRYHGPFSPPCLTPDESAALGKSWKLGIAAELIGLLFGSLGKSVFHARIVLSSGNVISWTLCMILLCFVGLQLFLMLFKREGAWLRQFTVTRK